MLLKEIMKSLQDLGAVCNIKRPRFEFRSRLNVPLKICIKSSYQAYNQFQLKERGYTNIDALDGSKGMLEKAKEKNIYQNLIHTLLGPHPIDGIEKGDFLLVSNKSFVTA